MAARPLNEKFLLEDECFGCGLANPVGLQLKVFPDPDDPERIIGHFRPGKAVIGFPGLTHGGIVFTALDCMASWAGMRLAKGPKAVWVLRSAQVTYHRPAPEGGPLILSATIPEPARVGAPQMVHNEARNEAGELLVHGRYRIVPLAPQKFKSMLKINELPAGITAWLESTDSE